MAMLGLSPKPVRTHLSQVRNIQNIQIIVTATGLALPCAGCLALILLTTFRGGRHD